MNIAMLLVCIMGSAGHAAVDESRGSVAPVSVVDTPREEGSVPVAYSALAPATTPGCTPYLEQYPNGHIFWGGCPTTTCHQNDCVAEEAEGSDGAIVSCDCQGGAPGQLCLGTVHISNLTGQVTDWFCLKRECLNTCTRGEAPLPPAIGSTIFFVCFCG